MRKEQQVNKYLDVEGIVTFSIKVTFPIPVWAVGKGNKCPIHKTPSTPPGLARMGLDPVLCIFLFRRGWEMHSQLPELWMEDSCYNPTSYEVNHLSLWRHQPSLQYSGDWHYFHCLQISIMQ